jgi:MarR family transcriptional regulator, 2-MHQ and catechol-resistance regulon repressor
MGTHYRGTEEEVRSLDAYIKLMRGAASVAVRLERRLAEAGLTERQFGVLETLHHLGPLPQCDLVKKQFTTGGNITFIVDNLERAELVERRRNSDDRRYVTVHLTEKGRVRIAALLPHHVSEIVEAFSILTPSEQVELGRLMKRLGVPEKTTTLGPR